MNKPRVTLLANGNRQFDMVFKTTVVRAVNELRKLRGKAHGNKGINEYLSTMGITHSHARYWAKQFNQGHFTSNRAIAFSRQDIMIHG